MTDEKSRGGCGQGYLWAIGILLVLLMLGGRYAEFSDSGERASEEVAVPSLEDWRRLANSVAIAHSHLFYHSVCSDAEERDACEEALRFVRSSRRSYECVAGSVEEASSNKLIVERISSLEFMAELTGRELAEPGYWSRLAADQDEFAGIDEDDTVMDLLKKGYDWGVITRAIVTRGGTKDLPGHRLPSYDYFYLSSGMCGGL